MYFLDAVLLVSGGGWVEGRKEYCQADSGPVMRIARRRDSIFFFWWLAASLLVFGSGTPPIPAPTPGGSDEGEGEWESTIASA